MRCYGDKPSSFTAMVPSGLLPVMRIDGGPALTESDALMTALEARFGPAEGYPRMVPTGVDAEDARLMGRHTRLRRLERRLFGLWLNWRGGAMGRAGPSGRVGEASDPAASDPAASDPSVTPRCFSPHRLHSQAVLGLERRPPSLPRGFRRARGGTLRGAGH